MGPLERTLRRVLNPLSSGLTNWWLARDRRQVPPRPGAAPRAGLTADGACFLREVASPGQWIAPAGQRPAWEWLPEHGASPNLQAVPRWVRVWFRTPFIDRFAYEWMWWHGGWSVLVPVDPPPSSGGGVREPRRPLPVGPSDEEHRDVPISRAGQ